MSKGSVLQGMILAGQRSKATAASDPAVTVNTVSMGGL